MERKIGEVFEYNGEWYQCLENNSHCCGCEYCDFGELGDCDIIAYSSSERNDNKEVYFKKLEKVGEPITYMNKTFQRLKSLDDNICKYCYFKNQACNPQLCGEIFFLVEIKQAEEDMEEYRIHDAKEDIPEFDKVVDECLFGEDKLNLKPFDIEAVKTGKPVCTRDGRKARILCFDRVCCDEISTIVACVLSNDGKDENVIIYSSDGFMVDKQHPCADDLMMLPEKEEGWVNVYKERVYKSKEEAVKNKYDGCTYIDTIKVEWEE